MGAGGLIAVAGGLLFLFLTVCAGQSRVAANFSKLKLLARTTA
jgi:hypothetical protein